MEVHHPHHPTYKKKWSEYILEFFMLFTAVTLGFIAENIREHNSELDNTNKSLVTLYKDIKADSLSVSVAYDARKKIVEADSIIMGYYYKNQLKIKVNELYLFDFMIARRSFPKINRMALDELNSNGKLNFIENVELKQNIQNYFQLTKEMEARKSREHEFLDKNHDPLRMKYFDIYNLNFIKNIIYDSLKIKNGVIACNIPSENLDFKLINESKFQLIEYLNTANYIVALEKVDDLYYIIPIQKDIKTILSNLRSYFKENNIKYN